MRQLRAWAAHYNTTWLLIKLTPKGLVFSFLFCQLRGLVYVKPTTMNSIRRCSHHQGLLHMSSHYIKLHSITQCTTLNLVYAVAAGNLSDPMPASLETSKSQLRIPKLQQVLEWLALLFDAHITSFHRQPGSVKVCFLFLLLFFLLMGCAPLPLLMIYAVLISSVESSSAFFVIEILKVPCVAHSALCIRQSGSGEMRHHF